MILSSTSPGLVFVALLGACIWIGGFVTIVVVARVAAQQLEPPVRVAFFRAFGRRFLLVGAPALTAALAAGGVLLSERPWDGTALAATIVGVLLVLSLIAGVVQARGMTRLRTRVLSEPDNETLAPRVRRGSVVAASLRAAIGLLSIGLLALAAVLAT